MVPFLDLRALHEEMRGEIERAVNAVLDSGQFVLGDELTAFEREFASFVGARECVGVGNGLDAINLALRALGLREGDEVLVPSHTFVATWLGVSMAGGTPVPVEPSPGTYLMDPHDAESRVTPRTRAILLVHLYGEPADVQPFVELCQSRDLILLQDAAQAHGARFGGRPVGSCGTATWSFYPGKNLGALGDGGAVTTDDEGLATRMRRLRNYGSLERYVHEDAGLNSRLDEVQAAILRVKLRRLEEHNARRDAIAHRYLADLRDTAVQLPPLVPDAESAWHLFVIRSTRRDQLRAHLEAQGVQAQIHYPRAVHQQRAYQSAALGDPQLPMAALYAREVLSLPIGPTMSDDDVTRVVESVHLFQKAP